MKAACRFPNIYRSRLPKTRLIPKLKTTDWEIPVGRGSSQSVSNMNIITAITKRLRLLEAFPKRMGYSFLARKSTLLLVCLLVFKVCALFLIESLLHDRVANIPEMPRELYFYNKNYYRDRVEITPFEGEHFFFNFSEKVYLPLLLCFRVNLVS